MDTQPEETKPISDDQELAKALAGITDSTNGLDFEETPAQPLTSTPATSAVENAQQSIEETPAQQEQPAMNQSEIIPDPEQVTPIVPNENEDLGDIKKNALIELRPLVDKLDLSPEEKFDIYLLLLRSTDDKTLIAPAHEAARNIPDETRRAQALLDVIKEIDYLSSPQQQQ
ncbi:MAG: hypothetical protein WBI29_01910 [Candidatus Saccharimonadales bacterium]